MSETDVSQLVELALSQFGDAWHCDNVCYLWIHNNWSETKGKPRPKDWGKQIKKLEKAVRDALIQRCPPPDPWARRSKSRSPPSPSRPHFPPRSFCSSLGSSSSAPDQDKAAIVARLMANPDAELKFDRAAASHVPLETLDGWISQLHLAVAESRVCSWARDMKPAEQGIHSLGISTLNYGYRFKFRFQDNECGELLYHGAAVGGVMDILRNNFRPRRTETREGFLWQNYGCVPPLVWFSRNYSCAAWYPNHMYCGQFALGEPLARDAPQPVRMVFHARVEISQRLAHKHQGNNDQHGFSPESVLSIVGLDVIATCFSLHTVNDWPITRLQDYCNVEVVAAQLNEILGQATTSPFLDEPFDPRCLLTKSPEEMSRLANLIQTREMLLQDQRELLAFHESIVGAEDELDAEAMGQLVRGASQRVRTLLAKADGITEAALDTVSTLLNSEDLADIDAQTKQTRKQLKKYKQKLRKAKADHYTDKCEVYEAACPDPIVAPQITEQAPARSSRSPSSYCGGASAQ